MHFSIYIKNVFGNLKKALLCYKHLIMYVLKEEIADLDWKSLISWFIKRCLTGTNWYHKTCTLLQVYTHLLNATFCSFFFFFRIKASCVNSELAIDENDYLCLERLWAPRLWTIHFHDMLGWKCTAQRIHISGRPGRVEMGPQIELSKTEPGCGPRLVLGLQLGCS